MSNDGRYVAFTSAAPNLVPGGTDENNQTDVFLYDRVAGTARLVSHASGSPSTAGDALSHDPLMSADGTVVVFQSRASDLVPGLGSTSLEQLYLYARTSGQSILITHAPSSPSTPAPGGTEYGQYAVSGDSRWVAFAFAGNLVEGQVDSNVYSDIFLFDRATGTNTLVSHASSSPVQTGNGPSREPSISADGRYLVFASTASNLVP